MSRLATYLEGYYTKQNNRFVFEGGHSLNQLAFAMWESLGCKGVDASVLSRVLTGKRLFTVAQLDAFCAVLGITEDEAVILRDCLRNDLNARLGASKGESYPASDLARQAIHHLSDHALMKFYAGDYDYARQNYDLVTRLVGVDRHHEASVEDVGTCLYMLGRSLSKSEIPSIVGRRIRPIFNRLIHMSKSSKSALLHGFAHGLLADSYYGAGGYSSDSTKLRHYKKAIHHAAVAISALPADHHERLFAYRTIAASAHYTGDTQTVLYVLRHFKRDLPRQPWQNYTNGIHLGVTLSKALAGTNTSDPFWVRDLATSYFRRTLSKTGAYEVSEIKEELETLMSLNCQDNRYIFDQVALGQDLANQYALKRHSLYFERLIRSL